MVTVIEDKKDLPASAHNGVSNHDNEQYQNIIRDFKQVKFGNSYRLLSYDTFSFQVDFHSFASCKPFPRNLTQLVESSQSISSVSKFFGIRTDFLEMRVVV